MLKYSRFLIIMPGRQKYIKVTLPKLRYPKSKKPYRKRELQKKRQEPSKIFSIFRYWRIGFIGGLMGLITIWLWNGLTKEFAILPEESHHHIPDYTLTDFKTIRMDEQGQLKTQLQAKTMMHFPNAKTELTTPSMVFYKEKKPTWIANAEEGEISPDGNQVWLLGRTTLQQHTQNQQKPMKIISRDVLVQMDTEYAETAASSTIIKHNDQTNSVGMRVFMPTEKVELLSQVRGHHVLP